MQDTTAQAWGRFTTADPLYLEARRLSDPQELNLYSYSRNGPLTFTDPNGLDVTLHCSGQENCTDTVNDVNNRENAQFQVTLDSNNVLQVEGDVDPAKLSESEMALYDAVVDPNNHATVDIVGKDANVDFGRFDGGGKNAVDRSDLNLANKAQAGLAGHIVSHEILEAYKSSQGADLKESHGYAGKFFGGLAQIQGSTAPYGDKTTMVVTGIRRDFHVAGTNWTISVSRDFVTPIPQNALATMDKTKPIPGHIISVEKKQ